jgi:general stress protein 26
LFALYDQAKAGPNRPKATLDYNIVSGRSLLELLDLNPNYEFQRTKHEVIDTGIEYRPMTAKSASKPARRGKRNVATPMRPDMPADYSPKDTKPKFVPWKFAQERLERSHNYWVCSTRPDGRPHSAPVWGVWLDGAFYFSTDPASRKGKNLKANPAISVHVESGDEPVIVEGRVEVVQVDKKLDAAYAAKYKMRLSGFPGAMVIFRLRPKTVLAWREKDFGTSATKWQLP